MRCSGVTWLATVAGLVLGSGRVEAQGDLHVDGHHTVEDTGIALGTAIARALGDRAGIRRYGDALVPLDDALVRPTAAQHAAQVSR